MARRAVSRVCRAERWLAPFIRATEMAAAGAAAAARMKGANYLSAQHARLTARRAMGRVPGGA